MDPNATLIAFLLACERNDEDGATEAIADLGCWIRNGGFLPRAILDHDEPSGAAFGKFDVGVR